MNPWHSLIYLISAMGKTIRDCRILSLEHVPMLHSIHIYGHLFGINIIQPASATLLTRLLCLVWQSVVVWCPRHEQAAETSLEKYILYIYIFFTCCMIGGPPVCANLGNTSQKGSCIRHPSCSPPPHCRKTSSRPCRGPGSFPQEGPPWSRQRHGTSCWTPWGRQTRAGGVHAIYHGIDPPYASVPSN